MSPRATNIFLILVLSKLTQQITSAGLRKFFLSPQSANPQPNFNFVNPQPQVRNWTFKSLVRNFLILEVHNRNFVILKVRNRKFATS